MDEYSVLFTAAVAHFLNNHPSRHPPKPFHLSSQSWAAISIAVTACQNRWNQLLTPPPAARSATTTSFLIEGINERSTREMIRCPKSRLAARPRAGDEERGRDCLTNPA